MEPVDDFPVDVKSRPLVIQVIFRPVLQLSVLFDVIITAFIL